MKLEDRKRLKRFWLVKGLLLSGAISGMTFAIIIGVPVILNPYDSISQKTAPIEYPDFCEKAPFGFSCIALNQAPDYQAIYIYPRLHLESLFWIVMSVGSISALLISRQIRNPYPLSWSGHLLLPEDNMAELIALKRRRQKQNLPQWKLYLELTIEVLLLLWAIHIQIRLQNLRLPPSKKRNID